MKTDQEKEVLYNSNKPKDIIPNKESKITSEIFHFMKKNKNKIFISIILILFYIIAIIPFIYTNFYEPKKDIIIYKLNKLDTLWTNNINNITTIENFKKFDYENRTFAIVRRENCPLCGLFSYFSVHLGCILEYLGKGYIPLIEVDSYGNVFNSFNKNSSIDKNLWEILFNQPFNYSISEVKKNAKNIVYLYCTCNNMAPSEIAVYSSETTIQFFRERAKKYMPVKRKIIDKVNILWKKLFNNSNNVLGVLARGTDYKYLAPGGHSKAPTVEKIIEDVKKMDANYTYDWIYLTTEDDKIKENFTKVFGQKLKILQKKNNKYVKGFIGLNKNMQGMKFQKLYLKSIIILSKCLDIIASRCNGAMGAFILSKGFRNSFVYFIGQY
jgi:hypothetical protein